MPATAAALTVAELGVLAETVLAGRLGERPDRDDRGCRVRDLRGRPRRPTRSTTSPTSPPRSRCSSGPPATPSARCTLQRLDCLDDDLLTILKYQGKTNELFTKLLLNVTVLASGSAPRMLTDRLRVLDPLCGRGTTLNQVLMYGWHAAGVDVDSADFDAYAAFLPRWLKDKRLKHTATTAKLRRDGRTLGRRLDVELADRQGGLGGRRHDHPVDGARRHPGGGRGLPGRRASTRSSPTRRTACSTAAGRAAASSGSPLELLAEAAARLGPACCAPAERSGIAINVRTCPRDDALALLATPAWSRATPRRTAASSTGSTRRSCVTSSWAVKAGLG